MHWERFIQRVPLCAAMTLRPVLLVALCASLALAGCTLGEDTPPTPTTTTPTATTSTPTPTPASPTANVTPTPTQTTPEPPAEPKPLYALTVSGLPTAVEEGRNFSYVLVAAGNVSANSTHLGAHYGPTSVADDAASTSVYTQVCAHQTSATPVPGRYNLTCSVPGNGTWYLRGHVRVGADNDSWASEATLTVRPAWTQSGNYSVNLSGVPTRATAGKNFTFNLTTAGGNLLAPGLSPEVRTGSASTGTPTVEAYTVTCSTARTSALSTSYSVSCGFPAAGVYYLRGHLRVSEGVPPESHDYWSGEYPVLVE